MIRITWFCLMLSLAFLQAQETELDPSIFDGTGSGTDSGHPPPPGAGEPERESGPESATSSTDPSAEPGEASTDPLLPVPEEPEGEASQPAASQDPAEEVEEASEEPAGPESLEEEIPEELEGSSSSVGSPASGQGESRAGEQVETSTRILPGQAVDVPWDM